MRDGLEFAGMLLVLGLMVILVLGGLAKDLWIWGQFLGSIF